MAQTTSVLWSVDQGLGEEEQSQARLNIGAASVKSVDDVKSDLSNLTDDVNTISAKADSNSDNISVLSGKVDNNIANIVSVSGKNTVQDNRLDVLDNKVAGLTNSATYHDAKIQNLENDWNTYSADLRNDFNTFSATEDAVITAATAAIPGQVSAEVSGQLSGQLSGKQDKLTPGVNISLSTAGVIDVRNYDCTADGNFAVAIGYHTSAHGAYSFACGSNTLANADYSHAEGFGTSAISQYSHAEGEGTRASRVAHAEGRMTSASNDYSHTEGNQTLTNGVYAHAEGHATSAITNKSHTEGQYTISDTVGQHVEGQFNAPAVGALHVIGNGTSNTNRSNAWEVYADKIIANVPLYPTPSLFDNHIYPENGLYSTVQDLGDGAWRYNIGLNHLGFCNNDADSIAIGWSTSAVRESLSHGSNTFATDYSHAEGTHTTANGQGCHAEGNNTVANGFQTHAEGSTTTSNGYYSHAEGVNTVANGTGSHAEGNKTIAQGDYSHAEGKNTVSIGEYSHAEGRSTSAARSQAHSEGAFTRANGLGSHAEGYKTTADGPYSHAEGRETVAYGEYQSVFGQWNAGNIDDLFQVGNGTSLSVTHNIFGITPSAIYMQPNHIYIPRDSSFTDSNPIDLVQSLMKRGNEFFSKKIRSAAIEYNTITSIVNATDLQNVTIPEGTRAVHVTGCIYLEIKFATAALAITTLEVYRNATTSIIHTYYGSCGAGVGDIGVITFPIDFVLRDLSTSVNNLITDNDLVLSVRWKEKSTTIGNNANMTYNISYSVLV